MTTRRPSPSGRAPRPPLLWRRTTIRRALRLYMRLWHRLRLEGPGELPIRGPALVVGNHASFLDLPVVMALDRSDDSAVLVLASMLHKPVIAQTLRAWNAIPVARDGQDMASLGQLFRALDEGKIVLAAAEGARSRSGRLGPVHPALAFLASRLRVPVIPVGVVGSFAAMPYGAFFPRPRQITVRVGMPIDFPERCSPEEASRRLLAALSSLLPPTQQAAPDGDSDL